METFKPILSNATHFDFLSIKMNQSKIDIFQKFFDL